MKNIRGTSIQHGQLHKEDHEIWTRRNFLSTVGMGGSLSLLMSKIPLVGMAASPLHAALSAAETDRVLVLVRLAGGNDGLNTIIPLYDYNNYQNFRPALAIPQSEVLPVAGNNSFGFNPGMAAAQTMWNNGSMKAIHGVGYENMSLSHFQGADIWSKGRTTNDETGFVGGLFDAVYPDYLINQPNIPPALYIGTGNDLILTGSNTTMGLSFNNVELFLNMAQSGEVFNTNFNPNCFKDEQLLFARSIANSTYQYSNEVNDAYTNSINNETYIGETINSSLQKELAIVARLIKGDLGTKIYLVELGGFDTHDGQLNESRGDTHNSLLHHLSENINLFFQDLSSTGHQNNVIAMTISEFGRRIQDTTQEGGTGDMNAAGTDHGEAAPTLLFGPALQGNGFIGTHPDMTDGLNNNNGNLEHTTDFRSVYSTILRDWLCVCPELIQSLFGTGAYSPSYLSGIVPVNNGNSIICADTSCPPNKTLNNQTLNGTQSHQSAQLTSSNGTVTNGADVKLKSEGRVRLNSGFKVEQGGKLKVNIEDCD